MDHAATLKWLLGSDPLRRAALAAVASFKLADGWIGAGFVRDAAWDYLHGYGTTPPSGDIDVLWFTPATPEEDCDRCIENELRRLLPDLRWSVKNQARMHVRNGDGPYASVADAMQHWPETATAVAARYATSGEIEINAPFGLEDLFAMRLRPTPNFLKDKLPIFQNRVTSKRWIERYPLLSAHCPSSADDGDEREAQDSALIPGLGPKAPAAGGSKPSPANPAKSSNSPPQSGGCGRTARLVRRR
jgi:hypothetical protein